MRLPWRLHAQAQKSDLQLLPLFFCHLVFPDQPVKFLISQVIDKVITKESKGNPFFQKMSLNDLYANIINEARQSNIIIGFERIMNPLDRIHGAGQLELRFDTIRCGMLTFGRLSMPFCDVLFYPGLASSWRVIVIQKTSL